MKEDINNVSYSPLRNHQYEQWFQKRQYDAENLSERDRREYLEIVNEASSHFIESFSLTIEPLTKITGLPTEYLKTYKIVISIIQFTSLTMIDGLALSKYFILADKDYDRSLMRGKLKVILNEGFKKLYGFNNKTQNKSEWNKLANILKYFPEEIIHQYQNLSNLLEKHSKASSWWKEERDIETHLDIGKLYKSRCEKISESQVIIDFLKLFDTLNAVFLFLSNIQVHLNNYLVYKFHLGELKEA